MAAVAHPESYDAARLLIEAGADVRATRGTDVEIVLSGAVSGGDPDYNGGPGHALNRALYGAHPEVARMLIENSTNLTLRSGNGHGTPPMV